ncbi:MAG: hypothetical protein IKR83_02310 [Bacteroidales bacterium]|nr:hypothetical protein [Bacteroidales bacterium]
MTRRWAITILAFLIVVLGGIAYRHWPRAVPWEECSTLYRHYAHADGIEATFIHNYKVNDTLSIDITLLQATDSAGWQHLRKDIKISDYEEELFRQKTVAGINIMVICGACSTKDQYVVASMRDRYACVFHTSNLEFREQIKEAIIEHTFQSTKHNKKLLQNEESIH